MNLERSKPIILLLALALTAAACGPRERDSQSNDDQSSAVDTQTSQEVPTTQVQPTVTEMGSNETGSQRHVFQELGISLEIPTDLYVQKAPEVNFDDSSKLNSYLFYIQNYGFPGGPSSGDFQMYGLLQYSLPPITWDQFAEVQNDSMYAYVNPIEVNGLRGFDAQFSGPRNRFVYLFHLEGHVLTIAVSDPTPENKARSDEILATLELLPEGLSDASHKIRIIEPNGLYRILIPDEWEYAFQPTVGTQLSSLESTSPGFEVVVEEVEGPHDNIYYKKGIYMHLQVVEGDVALENPNWPNQEEYSQYFNGIEGRIYLFVEPSTAEGRLREVRIFHQGRSYFMRFAHAQDAGTDQIEQIIASLELE